MERDAIIRRIQELKPFLNDRGVSHAALFGSRARADERPESDIDLLIDVDRTRSFSLLDLVGIEAELTEKFGLPFSLVMRRGLEPAVASSIARDAIEVF